MTTEISSAETKTLEKPIDGVSLIGRRHFKEILFALSKKTYSFNQLRDELDISAKVLSDALKLLENTQIVKREVQSTYSIRVNYSLTEKGMKVTETIRNLKQILEGELTNVQPRENLY